MPHTSHLTPSHPDTPRSGVQAHAAPLPLPLQHHFAAARSFLPASLRARHLRRAAALRRPLFDPDNSPHCHLPHVTVAPQQRAVAPPRVLRRSVLFISVATARPTLPLSLAVAAQHRPSALLLPPRLCSFTRVVAAAPVTSAPHAHQTATAGCAAKRVSLVAAAPFRFGLVCCVCFASLFIACPPDSVRNLLFALPLLPPSISPSAPFPFPSQAIAS